MIPAGWYFKDGSGRWHWVGTTRPQGAWMKTWVPVGTKFKVNGKPKAAEFALRKFKLKERIHSDDLKALIKKFAMGEG